LLGGALLFGTVVVLGKVALRSGLPVFSMLATRFAVSAVLLGVICAVLGQPLLAARGERLPIAVVALAGYAVEASLFFTALRHGTAAAVTVLFFTYPVIVALVSMALGHGAPGKRLGASLALSVAGTAVVVGSSGGLSIGTAGVVFALGSAAMYTAFLLGADRAIRRTSALTASMWVAAAASLGLGLYALVSGQAEMPSDWAVWAPIIGMSLATAGAFACSLEGLRRLGPVRTAVISATEPLAAAVLAFLFLREAVSWGTAVGGAAILAGAVIASLAPGAPPAEPPVP
jgi:drug/metabolite transporter (DMT)-like permease